MKILTAAQTREADAYTIKHEPIASIDLMERAATKCFDWLVRNYSTEKKFTLFCGVGNNGGDGLVIARLLYEAGYQVSLIILEFSQKYSTDFQTNLERLKGTSVNIEVLTAYQSFDFNTNEVVVDAIFGSGLTRPVKGFVKEVIQEINNNASEIIAIDLPSGMYSESNQKNNHDAIVKVNYTLTFQQPKLAMLFPENFQYVGEFVVLPIGLHPEFLQETSTKWFYTTDEDIRPLLHERTKFSHKGNFGHALLVAGSKGKIGAAVLAGNACLRSGVGLLTIHTPKIGCDIIQTAVPEAMCLIDKDQEMISEQMKLEAYTAIGVGPGIGTKTPTQQALKLLIQNTSCPLVLDADALNILSENKTWLSFIPSESILTPHPKEFERLVGKWSNDEERLEKQVELSQKYNIIVVLKGANTSISVPGGNVFFNSTGNPGMATGGSGDVLTGIITSLMAQGYSPNDAAIVGVYLHGYSGDCAREEMGENAMVASDIIAQIPHFFKTLNKS